MGNYLSVAVELVCGLGILFIILKLLGKTQFSQITPFDFISIMKSKSKKLFLLCYCGAC